MGLSISIVDAYMKEAVLDFSGGFALGRRWRISNLQAG